MYTESGVANVGCERCQRKRTFPYGCVKWKRLALSFTKVVIFRIVYRAFSESSIGNSCWCVSRYNFLLFTWLFRYAFAIACAQMMKASLRNAIPFSVPGILTSGCVCLRNGFYVNYARDRTAWSPSFRKIPSRKCNGKYLTGGRTCNMRHSLCGWELWLGGFHFGHNRGKGKNPSVSVICIAQECWCWCKRHIGNTVISFKMFSILVSNVDDYIRVEKIQLNL